MGRPGPGPVIARIDGDTCVQPNRERPEHRWATLEEAFEALPFGRQRDLILHLRRVFVEREPSRFLRIDIG